MVLLYCASTLYHAVPQARPRRCFRKLDHGAIFLLIAGTYTPFTLGALNGPVGLDAVRRSSGALAVVGVTLKAFDRIEHPLAVARPLSGDGLAVRDRDRAAAAARAAARARCCSAPAGSRTWRAWRSSRSTRGCATAHFIWHLFVLAGTACHFFAVLGYALATAARRQDARGFRCASSAGAALPRARESSASTRAASASTRVASARDLRRRTHARFGARRGETGVVARVARDARRRRARPRTREARAAGVRRRRRAGRRSGPERSANARSTNHGSVSARPFSVAASAASPSAADEARPSASGRRGATARRAARPSA